MKNNPIWLLSGRGFCVCVILMAVQVSGCVTKKDPPTNTMISPVMEISGGASGEKDFSTATVSTPRDVAETKDDDDSFTLEFKKGKFSITRDQNEKLREFVVRARENKKNFQLIGYAQLQPAGTNSDVYAKILLDANRRVQATSMILRLHGVAPDEINTRTDKTGAKGKRDVKLLLL
jgi:hypothetical protein